MSDGLEPFSLLIWNAIFAIFLRSKRVKINAGVSQWKSLMPRVLPLVAFLCCAEIQAAQTQCSVAIPSPYTGPMFDAMAQTDQWLNRFVRLSDEPALFSRSVPGRHLEKTFVDIPYGIGRTRVSEKLQSK
ncbi:hypothetical protein [Herbaspirillum sp.]|uniref:hypothetical protein n=1 Tax=Herbaspirillum sp. TaxID=1890675 RepID=UPI001B25AB46|nr:hypothetical protein [Herbaspirillum sp.]MBO9538034.1 hypothetical protein [Herbaspirillum sp.]